jgi:hypothetical protein
MKGIDADVQKMTNITSLEGSLISNFKDPLAKKALSIYNRSYTERNYFPSMNKHKTIYTVILSAIILFSCNKTEESRAQIMKKQGEIIIGLQDSNKNYVVEIDDSTNQLKEYFVRDLTSNSTVSYHYDRTGALKSIENNTEFTSINQTNDGDIVSLDTSTIFEKALRRDQLILKDVKEHFVYLNGKKAYLALYYGNTKVNNTIYFDLIEKSNGAETVTAILRNNFTYFLGEIRFSLKNSDAELRYEKISTHDYKISIDKRGKDINYFELGYEVLPSERDTLIYSSNIYILEF